VALPTDAQPLLPDALRGMSASDFAGTTDGQVKKAVQLLTSGK